MADRIRISVQFRKLLWICPSCKHEEWEDRPMEGGASYEHTCSKCKTWFNQSGGNSKEYNGTVNYSEDEYATARDEDIALEKEKQATAWLTSVKNPPPYVEPTKAQLEAEMAEKQAEVNRLQAKIDAKVIAIEE